MRSAWIGALLSLCACAAQSQVDLRRDDAAGVLTVRIDGRDVLAYRYAEEFALPHVHPLRSPSGKSLLVQKTEPYPHHRALWIADRVQIEGGPDVDFYHEWKNLRDPEKPELGHHSYIRHDGIRDVREHGKEASFTAEATWVVQEDTPVLADTRHVTVRDLGNGEYLVDLRWELRAAYGDVTFRSDAVHYAWPYLRMEPAFSGEHGGVIVDDQGRRGQKGTNGKVARWIDYSNTIEGVTEGVAVFVYPDGHDHEWLTREYGTFGPRRAARWNGTGFVLARGETIGGRVGILVHRGDAVEGRVAERYRDYVGGE